MNSMYGQPSAPQKPQRPWYKKKRVLIPGGFVALIIAGAAAGGGEDTSTTSEAKPEVTKTVTATPTPKATESKAAEKPKATSASDDKPKAEKPEKTEEAIERPEMGKLPNFVGMSHQDAQDTAQAAGFFNLREKDASGMERLMVWDRNWKVCKQEPAPGSHALEKTITLYSVKNDESC